MCFAVSPARLTSLSLYPTTPFSSSSMTQKTTITLLSLLRAGKYQLGQPQCQPQMKAQMKSKHPLQQWRTRPLRLRVLRGPVLTRVFSFSTYRERQSYEDLLVGMLMCYKRLAAHLCSVYLLSPLFLRWEIEAQDMQKREG